MPRVSIIIATYNRADLLPEAMRSVQAQTMPDWELIVVDDGSTDNTAEVVAAFLADARVRYLPQANQGWPGARNDGVRVAHGKYLAFLDSDDRYTPDALEAHLRVFAAQPDLGLTVAGYEYVNGGGQALGRRTPWLEGGRLDLAGWLFNCFAMPGAVLVRRAWFERVGRFNTDLIMAEDWSLFLQLAAQGCRMAWVPASTCLYRLHAGNSIRRLTDHLTGSLGALDLVFSRTDLPPAVVAQLAAARAWVYVMFARKALAANDARQAEDWLAEALRLDPALAAAKQPLLLEIWLTPSVEWTGAPDAYSRAAAAGLPAALRPTPGELRRLLARLAMGRFFHATAVGDQPEARRALRTGLRHDPAWLANRGVLGYLARQVWPTRKPA